MPPDTAVQGNRIAFFLQRIVVVLSPAMSDFLRDAGFVP